MITLDRTFLSELPDGALTERLYEIRKEERALLVEFLTYLTELDRRRVVLELGYPSVFAFCTDYLKLSKASTYRRTTAARLLARFPIIGDYLGDGRLRLTTLVELREALEEANHREILDRAAGRSEDQVRELVAALRPQPAPSDLLRRLPTPTVAPVFGTAPVPNAADAPPAAPIATTPASAPVFGTAPVPNAVGTPTSIPVATPPSGLPRAPGRIQPIAPQLHVLRVTVGADFVADLDAVRDALSHKLPGGGLEEILHECLRVTLDKVRRRRRGAGKKKSFELPPDDSRYVPTAVRDEVWERDGGQCTFVGVTGRRCNSRYRLELHHEHPFAMDGPPLASNLTLRCHAHNQLAAEQDFGRAKTRRRRATARG